MKAPLTLTLFGAGLVVVFGASYAVAAAVTPDSPTQPSIDQPVDPEPTEHGEDHS